MKRKLIVVLFSLVSLMASSCSKVDALFNNGEPTTEYRNVSHPFSVVAMYNNVNVKLVHDRHPHLELTCPKNLIGKVTTELKGDTLVVKNENDYNWLRSFDYSIDLTVYYDSIRTIDYASIGSLTSVDSIRGFGEFSIDSTEASIDTVNIKSFYLYINEGCGNINLPISCNVMKCFFRNGTSEVTLRGKVSYTEIMMRSYGLVHAENLSSTFVRVQSHSTNDAYVCASTKLTVWLHNIGNVYYKGNPLIVKECTSEGQVFKLE